MSVEETLTRKYNSAADGGGSCSEVDSIISDPNSGASSSAGPTSIQRTLSMTNRFQPEAHAGDDVGEHTIPNKRSISQEDLTKIPTRPAPLSVSFHPDIEKVSNKLESPGNEYYDYDTIRRAATRGSNDQEQPQKSIYSQSLSPQFRLLVTETSARIEEPTPKHLKPSDDEEDRDRRYDISGIIRTDGLHRDGKSDIEDFVGTSDEEESVVTVQPQPVREPPRRRPPRSWASRNGLSASLEILDSITAILIEPAKEVPEDLMFDQNHDQVFVFRNQTGVIFLYGVEHPRLCPVGTCASGRPFYMDLYAVNGDLVLRFTRKTSCLIGGGCFLPCLWQTIRAYTDKHTLVGTVEEAITLMVPTYKIYNARYEKLFTIHGPIGASILHRDSVDFLIYRPGRYIHEGIITNQWWDDGLNADLKNLYGVKFTIDLAPKVKVTLLAATVLIKYIYYESEGLSVPKIITNQVQEEVPEIVTIEEKVPCEEGGDTKMEDNEMTLGTDREKDIVEVEIEKSQAAVTEIAPNLLI